MLDFLELGDEYLYLSLAPFIGLFLDLYVSNKKILYLFSISIILMTPTIFGYEFSIPYFSELLLTLESACVVAFFSKIIIDDKGHKKALNVTLGISLMIAFGLGKTFYSAFGTTEITHVKSSDGYKIEKIISQGFSGGTLVYFTLKEYALIPLYLRQIDKQRIEVGNDCTLYFEVSELSFDICE